MKKRSQDRYGVNMKQFCRAHEAYVGQELAADRTSESLLTIHLRKLGWLQHERLIHLIVLCLTAAAELFVVDLALLHPETNPVAVIVMLVLAVLLGFYFAHYFFLENTVQHWYRLEEEIRTAMESADQ